ncbi:DUF2867 domain-containing protein [Paucibacter sp. Y2R2-4]|uniref:DUF2867 domain-containing protein n=1 Tax=Paucibacter sp. Y2R2-4 TaxID=2893553 RepID=UPI0021E35FCF|nr:DUF2867 domain-containing protein [Paucibacter sp. Y2R2-4]MCV2351216.1 DUF2867 domain-containing protein [Paucibacter sp. Y2R2-4]
MVEAAFFRDSYRTPLTHPQASVVEIFFAVFAHLPLWMKSALLVRNCLASACGLEVPRSAEILSPEVKANYRVGDKIGPWPIFALSPSELVAGRNNKHLDFRLSVLKEAQGETINLVISTVCTTHNTLGKLYLLLIIPFHKWGVQRLMSSAARAGRL